MRRLSRLVLLLSAAAILPSGMALAAANLPDFTAVVAKVSPVVVNVSTVQRSQAVAEDDGSVSSAPDDEDPYSGLYRRYFGATPPATDSGAESAGSDDQDVRAEESLGSGFIISADGEILTNYHVVENAKRIAVKLNDRRVLPARILGMDPASDLALLKINAANLPVAAISSGPVSVGQWVLAIGSPFGFDHSVTAGIVSAEGRSISSEQYVPYIQTDVPINPGNSGGPLFNLQGQVVGINSEIYSRTGGYQGVSFAIPISLAMQVVRQLRQRGHVIRGWLGVNIEDIDPEQASQLHLSRPEGALVRKVVPDSPAARAGLKAGDVILAYDGMHIVSAEALPPLVGSTAAGRDVSLIVLHQDRQASLRVRIGVLPSTASGQIAAVDGLPDAGFDSMGLAVRAPTPSERRQYKLQAGGVVVAQVAQGDAQRAGFKPGDVVLMVDGIAVISLRQFRQLEHHLPTARPVPVLVQRPDGTLFLPLQAGGS